MNNVEICQKFRYNVAEEAYSTLEESIAPTLTWKRAQILHSYSHDTIRYVIDHWILEGTAIIWNGTTGVPLVQPNAQLRFGQHEYLNGYRYCLRVNYKNRDKFEYQDCEFHAKGSTFSGYIGEYVTFRIHPYQLTRLERFLGHIRANEEMWTTALQAHQEYCDRTTGSFLLKLD